MRVKRKIVYIAIAAFVVVVGGGIALWSSLRPDAPRYITEAAVVGDVEKTVLASGTLEPRELVEVGAQASGQIQKLNVALGEKVAKGQLIAMIDPAAQEARVNAGQAQLMGLQAQLAQRRAERVLAEQQFKRQVELLKENATSKDAYDSADSRLKVSSGQITALEAQIQQTQSTLKGDQAILGYTTIYAPMDGVVVALVAKQGQTVNAVQSAPTIVKIAKLEIMTVKAQISEADVIRVKAGQEVYFTVLGAPERRYFAKMREIEPAPDSIRNSSANSQSSSSGNTSSAIYYNGLFDVENPDGELRTSMTAQVSIVLEKAKGAIVISAAALGPKKPDETYEVRVMDDAGDVSTRQVRIGINNNTHVEVLSGIKAGERVVVKEGGPRMPFPGPGPR